MDGELRLRPKLKDVGEYNEKFLIANKQVVGPPKLAKFLIIVKAPKVKANVTCPIGKLKDDCMPRITKIDD